MATKKRERKKKNGVADVTNDEKSSVLKPSITSQRRYKHKLEDKENNKVTPVTCAPTADSISSPTKIAKREERQRESLKTLSNTADITPNNESKTLTRKSVAADKNRTGVNRRLAVSTRSSRMRLFDRQSQHKVHTSISNTDNGSVEQSIPPVSVQVLPWTCRDDTISENGDNQLSCTSSVDTEHSFEFTSPSQDNITDTTMKQPPSYMKYLDFKTPVLPVKTRKKRNPKPANKTSTEKSEEEWINKMNKEFAEVDEFELAIQ